ncbi:hypothetical protein C8R44DRAFT_733827 [Mycena epipterygia]|nr:hypothetical protein C8R44DRAFT_733827 [Mycena epipterygia]
MKKVSSELLEPLFQFYICIRDDFSWAESTKTEAEKRVLRQRIRDYMEVAARLSDMILRYEEMAVSRQLPVPWVLWMHSSATAAGGSAEQSPSSIALLTVLDAIKIPEALIAEMTLARSFRKDPLEFIGHKYSHIGYVTDVLRPYAEMIFACIPSTVLYRHVWRQRSRSRWAPLCLPIFRGVTVTEGKFVLARFLVSSALPKEATVTVTFIVVAQKINNDNVTVVRSVASIHVGTVLAPEHFPMGRIDFLKPHVIEYICQCALLDSIAQEYARIHNQEPFLHPSTRETFLSRVRSASSIANLHRKADNPINIFINQKYASLPRVPSWNRQRISELMEEERQNEWACVNALLEEEVELSGRLGPALNKVENHISNGYALNPSGPYLRNGKIIGYHIFPMVRFFPPLYMPQRTVRAFAHQERLLVPDLVVLWVNRACHLAQQLYAATTITDPDNVPQKTVGLIREAIRVLLENMVILAKASHAHDAFGSEERPEFFVPAECTTLMGMAERFVDLYSYDGDDDNVACASLFDNLCIVYGCMVINPEYLKHPIDFPHFEVWEEHLLLYGMYNFIKRKQLGAVLSNSRLGGYTLGEKLRRYNPDLPEADVYKFADPCEEWVPTQPSTPNVVLMGHLSVVQEDPEAEKENVPV